ncbi:MAG: hypothetical protein ACRD3E_05025 [Terriglobales bacterium]
MYARATIVCLLLLGVTLEARSADVTTYGTGLVPCSAYLDARQKESSAEVVPFIDWLVGYFSGANATSRRHNNILGASDIAAALTRLDVICRHQPKAQYAVAAGSFMFGAASAAGAHSVEVTRYGSGFKPCQSYIEARGPQSSDSEEFMQWLGGYLSGVNAISLRTNDVLGTSELDQAVYWLDAYCSSHPVEPFSVAVSALVYAGPLSSTLADSRHRNR